MTDRQDGFERHLADALARPPDGAASVCPDAEQLAAYQDGGLDDRAVREIEVHVSLCGRCRAILAASMEAADVFAADAPALLPPARVLRFPLRKVAWVAGPVALAASLVLAVWVGRNTPPGSAEPPFASSAGDEAPRTLTEEKPLAGSADPSPSESASTGRGDAQASVAPAPDRGRVAGPANEIAPQTSAKREERTAAKASAEGATDAGSVPSAEAVRSAPPAAPAADAQSLGAAAARSAQGFEPTGAVAPAPQMVSVASPSGRTIWTADASGRISRTSDGRTGSVFETGARFRAGVAASETDAWLVGDAGAVWRTTDGETWTRRSAPTAAPFVAVTADGAVATVTSSDGVRYVTRDGGRTWTRLP